MLTHFLSLGTVSELLQAGDYVVVRKTCGCKQLELVRGLSSVLQKAIQGRSQVLQCVLPLNEVELAEKEVSD